MIFFKRKVNIAFLVAQFRSSFDVLFYAPIFCVRYLRKKLFLMKIKRLILFVFSFGFGYHVNAQVNQGVYLLGGSASASGTLSKSTQLQPGLTSFSWTIAPRTGKFISQNFAIGLGLNGSQQYTNTSSAYGIVIECICTLLLAKRK